MKKLYPTTIIPDDLYVNRGADRQLESCIKGMGRPGYVLVSRQMGKTNLLLNAKRKLTQSDRIFVYIDLSSNYMKSSDCFRDIIDTAIRTNEEIFSFIKDEIRKNREKSNLSPHKEHEIELLKLLKCFNGSIVVVLDEIDSLTTTSYSDQVFAQIRSVYFARANYDELNRLTYVLSGVVEPTEIIKDKSISPFNIGEKIYLDDFSYEEFITFLGKLDVEFSDDIQEYIYSWILGHPRMTWDVCSELESIFIDNGHVTKEDVDKAIYKLYLEKFDIPPVDHVRDLVRNNMELRRSVQKLALKPTELDSDIEKKLYLAGIIRNHRDTNTFQIKNKVLKATLSTSWLESIDRSSTSLFLNASENSQAGNYHEAILLYIQYLKSIDEKDGKPVFYVYSSIANCYRKLSENEKALEYYLKCNFDREDDPKDYYTNLYDVAICRQSIGESEKSILIFKEIIENCRVSPTLCKAHLNYAAIIYSLDRKNNAVEAVLHFNKAIQVSKDIEKSNSSDDNMRVYRTVCYMNIANVKVSQENYDEAKSLLYEAYECADQEYRPYVLTWIFTIEEDVEILKRLLNDCVSRLIDNEVQFVDSPLQSIGAERDFLSFSKMVLFDLLVFCFDIDIESFNSLSKYTLEDLLPELDGEVALFIELIGCAYANSKHDVSLDLSERVLNSDSSELLQKMFAYKYSGLSQHVLRGNYDAPLRKYIEIFEKEVNDASSITNDDLIAFAYQSAFLRDAKKHKESLRILNLINSFSDNYYNKSNYILTYFLQAQLADTINDKSMSYRYASEAVKLINSRDNEKTTVINDKMIDDISRICGQLKKKHMVVDPAVRPSVKVGRNDLCPCGSGLKFKKCCLE